MDSESVSITDTWIQPLRDPNQRDDELTQLREIRLKSFLKAFPKVRGGESFYEDAVQDSLLRILGKLDLFSGNVNSRRGRCLLPFRVGTSQLRRKNCVNEKRD